jgi:hypothetical protein
MHPPSRRSGPRPAAHGAGYGFTPASLGRRLSDPDPAPAAPPQARAADRYHAQLRFSGQGPGLGAHVARQDGALAQQARAGERAAQYYERCLTNARTKQAQWTRQLREPARPTAVISQGQHRSPSEVAARQRQLALAQAHDKYVENVALISGEFAPLVRYDPVIRSTAEAGLLVMGGVAVGGAVAGLPSGLRWAGTGLEAGTGLRASYTALRAAPKVFAQQAGARFTLDVAGQYGANVALGKGWGGSWGEINRVETVMSTIGMRTLSVATLSAAVSYTGNSGFQSIFYAANDPRSISGAKFMAQAAVGLTVGTFGGQLEEHLAAHQFRAWRVYTLATLLRTPRWGQPALAAGLRFGQEYGTPLSVGLVEETGEGFLGDKADDWASKPAPGAPAAPAPAAPTHPDSPVFK